MLLKGMRKSEAVRPAERPDEEAADEVPYEDIPDQYVQNDPLGENRGYTTY